MSGTANASCCVELSLDCHGALRCRGLASHLAPVHADAHLVKDGAAFNRALVEPVESPPSFPVSSRVPIGPTRCVRRRMVMLSPIGDVEPDPSRARLALIVVPLDHWWFR